jgi:SAM-dependent methyltransferase
MRQFDEHLLRCPTCKAGLLALRSPADREVRCNECFSSYPLRNGVIDLLPDVPIKRSLAQVAMESKLIVSIYESRWWRRNPLLSILMGISFEREYDLIVRAAELDGAERVLDLACGPGIYTRPFARRLPVGCVVGLDLSLPMLSYAAQRARMERLANLTFIRANALDLPFPAGHFDVVNCCGALHLFPTPSRALSEVSRVLRPGGRFTVAAFRRRDGRVSAYVASLRRRLLGVNAFTPDELTGCFREVGLEASQSHHVWGIWLIMSARKPHVTFRPTFGEVL